MVTVPLDLEETFNQFLVFGSVLYPLKRNWRFSDVFKRTLARNGKIGQERVKVSTGSVKKCFFQLRFHKGLKADLHSANVTVARVTHFAGEWFFSVSI